MEPDAFERLRTEDARAAVDSGASLDSEFMWFNQSAGAPIAPYKKAWFQSKAFRSAVSSAIQRSDMVRLVYRGYGTAAMGPVSPSNRFWFNKNLKSPQYDPTRALQSLAGDGFTRDRGVLKDRGGNVVEFSVITNAGSKTRNQLASMLQHDLSKIGIKVNVVPLEFRSLLERIQKTGSYEACLLGLTNIELDPNAQMNVWTSSGTHHPWNPAQTTPATSWEAEIDIRMREQASATDKQARKKAFDRVQEILAEQVPIIYLVHPNVLSAVSTSIKNVSPSVLPPHIYWNVERLAIGTQEER
jgi:peptide/nickel transport system substrate-binding protein